MTIKNVGLNTFFKIQLTTVLVTSIFMWVNTHILSKLNKASFRGAEI